MMPKSTDAASESPSTVPELTRLFASRWIMLVAVVTGLLLTCRSISNGLDADDYYHRSVLSGSSRFHEQLRGPQAMFRFFTGDAKLTQFWMDVGLLPWWTEPNIKAEFCQIIPTQTHILDYLLWPRRPMLMHVHSLVWFALLIVLVATFYRRMLGPTWLAGVATILFAIDDAHSTPVGWICNRNDLIAATFGVGCLIAHDIWRRDQRVSAFWTGLLLLASSLFSKEAGIATCAYLFAYGLCLDESSLWRRFCTLIPYGVVLIAWRTVRDSLGFGVANLGYYIDPITDSERFATALIERFPIFLFGQWAMLSDLALIVPKLLGSPFWWISVGYVSLLGVLLYPLLRNDRTARYFATGMLLAVIPSCATIPMDRLLTFVGLGAFGLLVQFWHMVFARIGTPSRPLLWRAIAIPIALLLILFHVVLAPLVLTARVIAPVGPRRLIDPCYVRMPFDEIIQEQDLIVVNSPVPMLVGYTVLNNEYDGKPIPKSIRTLAPGVMPLTVKRTDARTLEIEPETGYLTFLDQLFRSERRPLKVGEQVKLARMTATVLKVTEDGRPKNTSFHFETPLEDSSHRWICFQGGEFVPWKLPAIGETVVLKLEWNPKTWWQRFAPEK